MVIAQMDSIWVPKEILPGTATIVSVEPHEETTKRGKYTFFRLGLDFNPGLYQLDVKYSNKNFMCNVHGLDTALWIGKRITVRLDEAGYRQVT